MPELIELERRVDLLAAYVSRVELRLNQKLEAFALPGETGFVAIALTCLLAIGRGARHHQVFDRLVVETDEGIFVFVTSAPFVTASILRLH